MPGRGGYRKHVKKGNKYQNNTPLLLANDQPGCMYAVITKKQGTSFEVQCCATGKMEYAKIRGSMRKKVWVNINDVVLIENPDLGQFYIINKYTPDQVRQLKAKGEIKIDAGSTGDNVVFDGDINAGSDSDEEIIETANKYSEKVIDKKPLDPVVENDENDDDNNDDDNNNNNNNNNNNKSNNDKVEDEENNSDDDTDEKSTDSSDKEKKKTKENNLVNKDKLMAKFKHKTRGGKSIVRERGRAVARAKKRGGF